MSRMWNRTEFWCGEGPDPSNLYGLERPTYIGLFGASGIDEFHVAPNTVFGTSSVVETLVAAHLACLKTERRPPTYRTSGVWRGNPTALSAEYV